MRDSSYIRRIADDALEYEMEIFGAVLIEGPAGCGKSTTGKQFASSVVDFRDSLYNEAYVGTSQDSPTFLLNGEYPRLFAEWQNAPLLWDAMRYYIDRARRSGLFILTGQSPNDYNVRHNGIGRISSVKMWPMSLYESGESSGEASLCSIIDNPDGYSSCKSRLTMEDIADCVVRGGWPKSVCDPAGYKKHVGDIYDEICERDLSKVCGCRNGSHLAARILKIYAEGLGSCSNRVYPRLKDDENVSAPTVHKIVEALKQLYVIEDIPPWSKSVRSRSHLSLSGKFNLADPSLAVRALGLEKKDFYTDFALLKNLFECLCYRDIKVYSSALGGRIHYYHDRMGLDVDCVLCMNGGKYALIDFELGQTGLERGAKNLCKLERIIKAGGPNDTPAAKILITGTEYGYRRSDGVCVVPVGCLRD